MLIDNHKELRAQYNPDGSDLRVAQLKMLQMLKFIDGVCNQLSISYWLESGTLLGAARHDGFIPWDDDVDICMLTDDYKIFEQYMLIHNPSKQYVLQCHLSDAKYFGTWGVLRDLYNTYIKKDCRLNGFKYQGLQVDIFPVDRISRSRLCWKVCRWMYAWMVDAPLYKGRFLKYIRWNVPIAFFILTKVVIPFLHSISMEDKQNLFYRYGMFWWRKYNVDDLFPLGKLEFEGCVFNVPRNVDSYLTECFGDWKTVPPPEKRYNHNFGFHFMD